MKKVLLVIIMVLSLTSLVLADSATLLDNKWKYVTFSVTSAASSASKNIGYAREGTCNFSGTWGTATIDVEGSVDNSNWDDLVNDVSANGNYSFGGDIPRPFNYIRVTGDTFSSGTATIHCTVGY